MSFRSPFATASVERAELKCTSETVNNSTIRNPPVMRLKQPSICDPEVRQYSGYLDMEDKHIFFWYFGSRKRLNPKFNLAADKVPLVFWFSGGPGCSSQIANWQENGPCMYRNPYAWNNVADIVFIDQPVGAGFSYGKMPSSTEASADTAWRTMQAVYSLLSADARKNNEAPISDVHIFGESYAGRYIPVFSEYLLHMNDQITQSADLQSRGYLHLPLRGIGVGNGMFDYQLQTSSYYTMGCRSNYPPLFSAKQCTVLKSVINPTCSAMMSRCYGDKGLVQSAEGMRTGDCIRLEPEQWRLTDECAEADSYCNGALNWTTLISTYDVRPNARMVPDDYVKYLQSTQFVDTVGAASNIEFTECSDAVFDIFASTTDEMSKSAKSSLEYILERNVPVLLYNGDADFICNWHGTMAVARALNWHGSDRFLQSAMTEWTWPATNGGGEYVSVDNFTFLRIYEAGHEVPFYQPQAALHMLSQFLANKKLS
ncbi:alpha/beta-hydrolase [Martensiomyces pterosporus]|nr:alpha/beta-hydrolase [Martensiomyces pterosporus]